MRVNRDEHMKIGNREWGVLTGKLILDITRSQYSQCFADLVTTDRELFLRFTEW